MSNNNKDKGKVYEREIAKYLSTLTGKSFTRVPNSGAFIGGKNKFRADTLSEEQTDLFTGDIIVPPEWNHVCLECKWYKKIGWSALFSEDGECNLNNWIEQASQSPKPLWFICFKINRLGQYVVYDRECFAFKDLGTYMIYRNAYKIQVLEPFFEQNWTLIEECKNVI
jgi:hypothetical protein